MVSAFDDLGASEELRADTESDIEAFVCQLYEPGTTVVDVGKLRWRLFTKKQLEAQKLPPTRGALHQAIARSHYQAMVWHKAHVPDPSFHNQQNMDGEQKEIIWCPSQPRTLQPQLPSHI